MNFSYILHLILVFAFATTALAQVPAQQQASGQEALRQQQEQDKKLRETLQQPKAQGTVVEQPVVETQEPEAADTTKVLINTITVSGNAILSQDEITKVTTPFEGKELSVRDMQKVADLVTDVYRKKGFITTRAILPPQQVTNNTLELNIVQGLMGNLEVKGNRYFKKSLFTKRVSLKKGEPFNYDKLRNDLNAINQFPDRNVKTVITPGQEPGQTDVVFDVKDRLPIHVGFSYDNFASKYIGKNRYTGTVTDNNLLGFDDILTFQYQTAEMNAFRLTSLRYLAPVSKNTEVGFFVAQNQIELQEEFQDLQARGKSKLYSAFVNQTLLNEQNLKVVANAGFDYKDVFNYQLGVESSRDRLRVVKTGINVDYADQFNGRNIFNNEIAFGIPNIMGGMRDVDPRSSRAQSGSGALFTKDIVDLLRLQRMPFDSSLLLKSQFQFSGNVLPATEQFQLGGITNIRGFAPGEAVGDNGQSFTTELSLPLYMVPKSIPIPFSKAKLYDAVRFSGFYDWGSVQLRNPQAGEFKSRFIDSLGCGLRVNLPEDFFLRVDFAWGLNGTPSDGKDEHTWMQITKEF